MGDRDTIRNYTHHGQEQETRIVERTTRLEVPILIDYGMGDPSEAWREYTMASVWYAQQALELERRASVLEAARRRLLQ